MTLKSLFLAVTLLLAGCGEDNGGTTSMTETVATSTETVTCSAKKGSMVSFDVNCSGSWTAYSNDGWITDVAPEYSEESSGTVTATVDENLSSAERTGSIVVKCGSVRHKVAVVQEGVKESEIEGPEGYSLVWHDEFDDGDRPSTKNWYYETGNGTSGWGNNEEQYYVSPETPSGENLASISDGILSIICMKEGDQVYSIRMNTVQSWTYGYMEASIQLPSGKGSWPAFWMMPAKFTSWPDDGEIDIMEEVGYDPNVIHSTIHCNKYNNSGTAVETATMKVPTAQTEFHKYAVEWAADHMTFYVDGAKLLTYQNDGTGKDAWPFDSSFYLKLNVAWGGDWGGKNGTDESALPATMKVDYVRVFQKQ